VGALDQIASENGMTLPSLHVTKGRSGIK